MELNDNKEKLRAYRARAKALVGQMTLEEKAEQTFRRSPAIERLGDWASRNTTGGMRRFMAWHEQVQRQCFHKRLAWQPHLMRI